MAKSTTQKLVKKLDDIVRDILKKKYPNVCVTCNKHVAWYHPKLNSKGLQVGHFISRRFKLVRWHLRNVHPQCSYCNYIHLTNTSQYSKFMVNTYGIHILDELNELAQKNKVVKLSTIDLQNTLDELTKIYNAL